MKKYVEPTMPLLRFEQHYNQYRINLGFDVDFETGVLAVGTFTALCIHCYPFLLYLSHKERGTTGQINQYPRPDDTVTNPVPSSCVTSFSMH